MSTSADSPRPETASAGWGDTNVRVVQDKLREAGLYFGEIGGSYSSELAAALGRYSIRNDNGKSSHEENERKAG